jgi:hypothetical protein
MLLIMLVGYVMAPVNTNAAHAALMTLGCLHIHRANGLPSLIACLRPCYALTGSNTGVVSNAAVTTVTQSECPVD